VVKKSAKRLSGQMNLSLLNPPVTIIPDGKQGELTLALVELLTSAAQEDAKQESQGGRDDFEAHA
jgi:hypothetical protein